MADIKNYGLKGVGNDVQMGKSGGRLKYNTGTGVFSFFESDGSTLENISAAGATVTSLTDGTLTISAGNITSAIDGTFSGNVQFGGLSDGNITIAGYTNDLDTSAADNELPTADAVKTYADGASLYVEDSNAGSADVNLLDNTLYFAGTANEVTVVISEAAGDGTVTIGLPDDVIVGNTLTAVGNITAANLISNALVSAADMSATGTMSAANITASGVLSFGSLTDGTITVDSFTGNIAASAEANQIATADTVKAYVDSKVGAATANIAGDSGSGNVDLDSQTLTVSGTANEIETTVSGQTITVGIVSNPTLTGNVSAGTYSATGNITGANLISNALVSAVDVSASSTMTATGNITGGNLSTAGETSTGTLVATGNASAANFNTTGTVATGTLSTTGNATIGGSLLSDDITAASIAINGDATISGNLTVNGTQTIVNSTVVSIDDAVIMVNSDGQVVNAGLVANIAGVNKELVWNVSSNVWSVGSESFQAATFLGNLTGTAANATVLQTARNFSASGDATASAVSFDGSANVDLALTLANTAVTAGTYGSATQIPQFTVDSKGRVTAASNVSISTYWNLAGDTGSSQIDGGQTANVLGGTNITTSVSGDSVTIDLDNDVTLSGNLSAVNGTFSGALSGGNITTAGTMTATGNITGANLISNALVSAVTMTATGNVTAGNLSTTGATSTGTLAATGNVSAANVVSTGDVSGVTGTFSGTVSANNLNVTNAITVSGGTGGSITGANSITANYFVANQTVTATGNISGGNISTAGVLSFGSLTDGSITVDSFTGNIFASAAANQIATADTVKAYIDAKTTAVTANIAGDSGTGAVDLDSQTLTVSGTAGEIDTSVSGQTITVGIVSNPTLTGTVSGGAFTATGNITGANLFSNALVSAVTVTASGNVSGAHLTTAGTVTATGNITGGNLTTAGTVDAGTLSTSGNATVGGNLTVSGTLLSDDITSSAISITGDATITGNLTVQGTQTIVNSTTVSVGDAIIRVNSDGTVVNAGLEANIAGSMKQLVWNTTDNRWTVGSETFAAGNVTTAGTVSFGSLYDSGANVTVNSFVTSAATIVGNNNDTSVPTTAAVIDYVGTYGGDGLLIRAAVGPTAAGGNSNIVVGMVPDNATREYYLDKVVIGVVDFAFLIGDDISYITLVDGDGAGFTLVTGDASDISSTGTYVIEAEWGTQLTKGGNIVVKYFKADNTEAVPTSGWVMAEVKYNYVNI